MYMWHGPHLRAKNITPQPTPHPQHVHGCSPVSYSCPFYELIQLPSWSSRGFFLLMWLCFIYWFSDEVDLSACPFITDWSCLTGIHLPFCRSAWATILFWTPQAQWYWNCQMTQTVIASRSLRFKSTQPSRRPSRQHDFRAEIQRYRQTNGPTPCEVFYVFLFINGCAMCLH